MRNFGSRTRLQAEKVCACVYVCVHESRARVPVVLNFTALKMTNEARKLLYLYVEFVKRETSQKHVYTRAAAKEIFLAWVGPITSVMRYLQRLRITRGLFHAIV